MLHHEQSTKVYLQDGKPQGKMLKIRLSRGFKLPTQMKDVQCYANWYTCVTYRFSGPLASALIINYGARVVMMLGAALMATGTLISGFVPNIYFLYMTMGVITGLYFPAE